MCGEGGDHLRPETVQLKGETEVVETEVHIGERVVIHEQTRLHQLMQVKKLVAMEQKRLVCKGDRTHQNTLITITIPYSSPSPYHTHHHHTTLITITIPHSSPYHTHCSNLAVNLQPKFSVQQVSMET